MVQGKEICLSNHKLEMPKMMMMQKKPYTFLLLLLISFAPLISISAEPLAVADVPDPEIPKLENPMTLQYLRKNLRKSSPRLVLNPQLEKKLRKKIKSNPVIQNMYKAIQLNAESIQKEPLLERKMDGRRLLSVSRAMLYRMNMLGMVYRIDQDPEVLHRINDELLAVCSFTDWNPSHFLDVAEMAMAVSLALDWTGEDLPPSTVELAKTALMEKGINPSYSNDHEINWWINTSNNWNQVCHGGMVAAAIVIADKDPELAARTIHRALENLPHALIEYGPDGVYPEGAMYWEYGTSFTVITASMLESAFGTDFGIADYPSFKESADFRLLCEAPSGWYYNFGDSSDKRGKDGNFTLAWFAAKTGNSLYFEKERFLLPPEEIGKITRLGGAGLVWLAQYEEKNRGELPLAWKGDGPNPVVFFRGGENDPHQYYLGAKGGRGTVNHGNMDGGSFVFELNGVRWSIDPGNQSYNELEQAGFDLWDNCQHCERWKLLTKNNFGHSTLTVNEQLHVVDGMATIEDFKDGAQPEATIDMTPTFEGQLNSAKRKFVKDSPASLLIEDQIELHQDTKMISWQLMTTAEVEIVRGGAVLKQDGKKLKLENLSHPDFDVSVISLDPAPLKLDRQIEDLKRVEIRVPAWTFENGKGLVKVRLSGE